MKLTCPVCGAALSLDQAGQAEVLVALGRAAAAFGEDWDLVSEYLELFRARPGGPLLLKKRLRLAREGWVIWERGYFECDGRGYRVSREAVREALRQMGNRGLQGLKNHNYLKRILVSLAQEESRAGERERREQEDRLRAGWGRPAPRPRVVTPENVGQLADPECPECGGQGMTARLVPGLRGEIMVRCRCTEREERHGPEAGGDGD